MESEQDKMKEKYDEIMKLYRANEIMRANKEMEDFIALAREMEDHYYYAMGLNFLGVLQGAMGNIPRAVDYYFDTILYGEKYQVNEILPAVYNNIGSRYLDSGAFETALIYLKKAEAEAERTKDNPREIGRAHV